MSTPRFKITQRSLQRDSGNPSGMYLFRNGLLMFVPLSDDVVLHFTKESLKHGVSNTLSCVEAMLMKCECPTVVPTQGDGTHGAAT